MSQILSQEGRFKARPKSWVVEENPNTSTLQFVCSFGIISVLNGDKWEDWQAHDLEKTGYFYLAKKDGSPNEACIRSLREALGWDGVDLEALQQNDWSQKVVQITVGYEQYNGEQRLKVRFINPESWAGASFKALDQPALKSLNAKWGAKLRAIAPKGAHNASVAPKTPTPTPPPRPAPACPAPPPPTPAASPRDAAWACVLEIFDGDKDLATGAWLPLLARIHPDKPESDFTAADWSAVAERAGEVLPF